MSFTQTLGKFDQPQLANFFAKAKKWLPPKIQEDFETIGFCQTFYQKVCPVGTPSFP